ncbi:MAG: gfo/Idh/MocA family oxidoreductase [Gemmataceae bacterium]|nr:gfo/Idh/MocA family oxidoreductase [Gemmataceae bacterium]
MDLFSRREFLERSAILSAAAAALGSDVLAADRPAPVATRAGTDKLRVAVVGVRGRGMAHVGGFLGNKGSEITTVCDCDEAVIGPAMKAIEGKQGAPPRYVKDIRRVVEDKTIDVVSIATPNHWHALMAIWAMQNGKDVYVEKPASHNVREGAAMLAAARKYNRICQVGTQSRSNPGMRDSIAAVRGGKIGTVDLAIGLCYKSRPSIGKVDGPQDPPATMDFNLWCGPGPLAAPHRKTKNGTVHYDWHWTWDYGNGDLGNQGVHEMDKARWGLNKKGLPIAAVSVGGRFGYVDDGETANTQLSLFDYGDAELVFEVRGLKTDKYKDVGVGNIFVGSEGMVVCPSYDTGIVYDKGGKEIARFKGGNDQYHFDNFVKAVRSRKADELNADIAEGHLSAALCHLANISYRLGTESPFDRDITAFADCKEAAAAVDRMKAHLKANGVDLAQAVGRVGAKLTIDTKTETFTGSSAAKANPMLTREYRKGFEVKEVV